MKKTKERKERTLRVCAYNPAEYNRYPETSKQVIRSYEQERKTV